MILGLGVMVITYGEVSVAGSGRLGRRGASFVAPRARCRAAGALDNAGDHAADSQGGRGAARRRTIYRSVTAAMTALAEVAGCVTNQYEAARALGRLDVILPLTQPMLDAPGADRASRRALA